MQTNVPNDIYIYIFIEREREFNIDCVECNIVSLAINKIQHNSPISYCNLCHISEQECPYCSLLTVHCFLVLKTEKNCRYMCQMMVLLVGFIYFFNDIPDFYIEE